MSWITRVLVVMLLPVQAALAAPLEGLDADIGDPHRLDAALECSKHVH